MPEEFDVETFDRQVDQIFNRITTTQSDALIAGLTTYYKAGSDDIRPSSRLTNVQKNAIKKLRGSDLGCDCQKVGHSAWWQYSVEDNPEGRGSRF